MFLRFILLVSLSVVALLGDSKKLSKDLAGTARGSLVQVLVQFERRPTSANLGSILVKGGTIKRSLASIRAVAVSLPADALVSLAAQPEVAYISLDRQIVGSMDYTGPATGADTALQYGYDGAGVTVAVIDSGIANHKDLGHGSSSRVVYSESFLDAGKGNSQDRYGHGTHIAGVIGGDGSHSDGMLRGIAPKVRLVDLQALDANGVGTDSSVIHALQRAIELKDVYGIKVVNLSLGRPVMESYTLDPLCQAVEAAWKAGLTVVVAAGNAGRYGFPGSGGYWTITAPGNDPYVITVGAMKTMHTPGRGDDLIASYSSKGPTLIDGVVKPDLVAPGNLVKSLSAGHDSTLYRAAPANGVNIGPGGKYLQLSGTSMAAAVVSGAVALLLKNEPYLSPDQIKVRLMKTATKNFPASSITVDTSTGRTFRSQHDVFTVGAGYLDIMAAMTDGSRAYGPAHSPVAVRADSGAVTVAPALASAWTLSGGMLDVWGMQVFQTGGASAAWGSSAAWSASAAWGSSVAWSASAAWGSSAAWGASAAWGSSVALNGETDR